MQPVIAGCHHLKHHPSSLAPVTLSTSQHRHRKSNNVGAPKLGGLKSDCRSLPLSICETLDLSESKEPKSCCTHRLGGGQQSIWALEALPFSRSLPPLTRSTARHTVHSAHGSETTCLAFFLVVNLFSSPPTLLARVVKDAPTLLLVCHCDAHYIPTRVSHQ